MADKDSGEKTEKPSPKKLRDARKKGDVAKSKEVGATIVTLVWLLIFFLTAGYVARSIGDFAVLTVARATDGDFQATLVGLGSAAVRLMLVTTAALLVPVALVATLAESLQIGPIMTTEKLKPSLDKLNPIEGLKKMFSKDALVELVKTLAKALLVMMIAWLVLQSALPHVGELIAVASWSPVAGTGPAAAQLSLDWTLELTIKLLGWTVAAFFFIAILDRVWTKHSFTKKMMMSQRDIKQEYKSDEGDPHVKAHRKQLHQEFASSNPVGSAGGAAALLVNPTHLAIALDYDPVDCPVPVMAAKGQGPLAQAMRAEAERCGVPIIRNVTAARALWASGEVGEIVPEDLFDAIAEVILWARRARDGVAPMVQEIDDPAAAFARSGGDALA